MKTLLSIGCLMTAAAAWGQQPTFELADVHASKTPRMMAQNFGGVLRGGKYINRDVTMLGLIEAAYGLKADAVAG
jgi:uncharacterized protein (TIGR03435 family)